jgi:hypothetical protein
MIDRLSDMLADTRQRLDNYALNAAVQAVKEELADYPEARQFAWNIAVAALRAAAEVRPQSARWDGPRDASSAARED